MANINKELLHNLELRMKQLIFLCDSLKEENLELERLLAESEKSRDKIDLRLQQLQVDYDGIKFASSFVSNEEQEVAKQKLSRLVQDVDKCISLLKY